MVLNHPLHKLLATTAFLLAALSARAQCTWAPIFTDSYEYTTVIPSIIPGTTYQDTPQTFAGCIRTGNRGMYLDVVDGFSGLLYSQPFTNLCVGQNYRFSFSTRDASASNNDITVNIYLGTNPGPVLSQNILNGTTWNDIVMSSFTATSTDMRFEIVTNLPGDAVGNAIGFDDLVLSQCQPASFNITHALCTNAAPFNLYSLTAANLSTAGIWTGPSALTNAHLGTFTQGTNTAGVYQYTIGGAANCADSVANITLQLTQAPVLNPVSDVQACQQYTLPAIAGTSLNGNEAYYTGPNGTGTSFPAGTVRNTSQLLYIFGGTPTCFSQVSFNLTISSVPEAGNNNAASYCGPGTLISLNTFLSANAVTGGTWAETTATPSGQFNTANAVFTTAGLTPGTYTFSYTHPASGACPADVATFSISLGNFPQVNIGPDTTLCQGQSIVLNAATSGPYDTYQWNNNSTLPTRTISVPGTFWVKVGILGNNQIVNGDFEQGVSGFSTDYVPGTGGTFGLLSNPGTYAISTSPNLVHNDFTICQDHTPAPGTKMLIVNGAGTANTDVWCQTVPVQPNTVYQFGTWVTSALTNFTVAQLQFSINGVSLGPVFSPGTSGCSWSQYTQNWNSGSNTTAQICILNQNTNNSGNDFVIDDITLRPVCYSYDTIVVAVSAIPTVNLGPDLNACAGETVTLDAQNVGNTYLWSDGTTNQTLDVTTSGTYSVTVRTPASCPATDAVNVQFEPSKNAGSDSSDTYCKTFGTIQLTDLLNTNANTGGQWRDKNNVLAAALNTTTGALNISQLAGIYEVEYIVFGTFCPNDTALFTLTVYDQPNAGPDNILSHLCNTPGTVFDANPLLAPINTVHPGHWVESTPTPSNQFDTALGILDLSNLPGGNYILQYILPADQPCVNDTATMLIRITEVPVVQFTSDTVRGCQPLPVFFTNQSTAEAGAVYDWDLGDGTHSNSSTNVGNIYEIAQCYPISLTVTSGGICSASLVIPNMICVDQNPIASFYYGPQQVFSDGPTVQFTNTSILNQDNIWDFGDGTGNNLLNPSHAYPMGEIGNYLVQLTVISNAGCRDSTTTLVIVKDQLLYYVPNTFTPDGDEYNNIFKPVMTAGFDPQDYRLLIFNRWGEIMFESHDASEGWDGTYNGRTLPSGTYLWTIDFGNPDDDGRHTKEGHITLLR
jgi:gliding motility-associated-like protein